MAWANSEAPRTLIPPECGRNRGEDRVGLGGGSDVDDPRRDEESHLRSGWVT